MQHRVGVALVGLHHLGPAAHGGVEPLGVAQQQGGRDAGLQQQPDHA
ncbi:MAG TPA: hypothetical protein VEZ18_06600 [Geodermatophilus sp.]|nr:hypothetical protein [Geodermatophilus sp.]